MAIVSRQHDLQKFQSELNESVDDIQTMINHLGTVKDDISNLQNEIDRHQSGQPAIYQMNAICGRCTRDTLNALSGAGELRSKHEQLCYLFSNPTSTSEARTLTLDIQRLSGYVFATVNSIKHSLDDIDYYAKSLETPRKEPWWKKVLAWIRDLLTLAAAVTALIPGIGGVVAAALGIGVGLASVGSTFGGYGSGGSRYAALQAAVEQTVATRETLDEVIAFQPGLDQTTGEALSILDDYDRMKRMLAGQQANSYT